MAMMLAEDKLYKDTMGISSHVSSNGHLKSLQFLLFVDGSIGGPLRKLLLGRKNINGVTDGSGECLGVVHIVRHSNELQAVSTDEMLRRKVLTGAELAQLLLSWSRHNRREGGNSAKVAALQTKIASLIAPK